MRILHIRYSNLKKLPLAFENFKKLEQLSLRGNWDLDLAQSFKILGKIKTLKTLDLSFSRIEKLPKEICELKNIVTLYLSNWKYCCQMMDFIGSTPFNNVKKLPKAASEMKSLKNLFLWNWNTTEKEKKKMQAILPNTKIEFDVEKPVLTPNLILLK